MNKLILALCLITMSSVFAFAQDEYKKNEYYVGYSNQQVDIGGDSGNNFTNFFKDRFNYNGFEAAYTRNVSRYVGIKGSVSGAYRNEDFGGSFNDPTTGGTVIIPEFNDSIYNVLGGIQVKDNKSDARFKPFAQLLAGVAHQRTKVSAGCPTPSCTISFPETTFTSTGFAGAIGGGLDIKINKNIDLRAIQVDYNPNFNNNRASHNVRFGIGFVFK